MYFWVTSFGIVYSNYNVLVKEAFPINTPKIGSALAILYQKSIRYKLSMFHMNT